MPVTGVAGSPSLKVSTVGSVHGTPMVCLIRSTTSPAVSGCWAGETVGAKVGASAARTKHRDARMGDPSILHSAVRQAHAACEIAEPGVGPKSGEVIIYYEERQ